MNKLIKIVYFGHSPDGSNDNCFTSINADLVENNYKTCYIAEGEIYKVSDIFERTINKKKYYAFSIRLRNKEVFWCRAKNNNYQYINKLFEDYTDENTKPLYKLNPSKRRKHD